MQMYDENFIEKVGFQIVGLVLGVGPKRNST
jgi:hypothetical protein